MDQQISFSDFQKVDIRIGTVVEATVPEWSHWVMKLVVNLGPEIGKRTIFAGIMKFYKQKELVGKQFPFVVNLAPKKMGPMGDMSEGMMLAASAASSKIKHQSSKLKQSDSEETPVLFKLWKKVPNGTSVR